MEKKSIPLHFHLPFEEIRVRYLRNQIMQSRKLFPTKANKYLDISESYRQAIKSVVRDLQYIYITVDYP